MEITKKSIVTGEYNTVNIPVDPDKYLSWVEERETLPRHQWTKIQDAFPELSASEREFILSGITSEEWNTYMKEPDYPE